MNLDWLEDPIRDEMPVGALADAAGELHRNATGATNAHLTYACACGHAIALARQKVEGSWIEWARAAGISRTAAFRYLRVYRNRDRLTPDMTMEEAVAITDPFTRPRSTAQAKATAARMVHEEGISQNEAARVLGVSKSTVNYWLKSSKARRTAEMRRARRRARAKAAEAELRKREHWLLSTQAVDPVSKGYALLRRAAQQLDLARASEQNRLQRDLLDEALSEMYAAEERVAAYVGVHVAHNGKVAA